MATFVGAIDYSLTVIGEANLDVARRDLYPGYLVFNEGTILHLQGSTRWTVVRRGTADISMTAGDAATLTGGDIRWVVYAKEVTAEPLCPPPPGARPALAGP